MIVNDNIKLIREAADFTQVKFATVFKVPLSSLKNYENTDVMPKAGLLNEIASVVKVSVDDLINKKLTQKDLNIKNLDMWAMTMGRNEEDKWVDAPGDPSREFADLQEKYIQLQNQYIEALKYSDQVKGTFQQMLDENADQRRQDGLLFAQMIGEISKRLDRFESQFDQTRKDIDKRTEELEVAVEKIEGQLYEIRNTLSRHFG